MAWTTPITWVAARLYASQLNQQIRDNMNFLYAPYACEAYHNTTKSIANNTWTPLDLNTDRRDTNAMHDPSYSSGQYIAIPLAGWWYVGAWAEFAANAVGNRGIRLLVDGATVICQDLRPNVGAASGIQIHLDRLWYWSGTSGSIRADVFQDSGGALNVSAGAEMYAIWLGNS